MQAGAWAVSPHSWKCRAVRALLHGKRNHRSRKMTKSNSVRLPAVLRLRREQDAVLVATDAAARGLDIPHIAHVVQADFAASAVDFLHRVRPHC